MCDQKNSKISHCVFRCIDYIEGLVPKVDIRDPYSSPLAHILDSKTVEDLAKAQCENSIIWLRFYVQPIKTKIPWNQLLLHKWELNSRNIWKKEWIFALYGNFRIFYSSDFSFYVKSILENLEVQNLPF